MATLSLKTLLQLENWSAHLGEDKENKNVFNQTGERMAGQSLGGP